MLVNFVNLRIGSSITRIFLGTDQNENWWSSGPMQMTIGEMYSYVEAAAIVTVMDLMVLHMHRQSAEIELNLPLDLNCSSSVRQHTSVSFDVCHSVVSKFPTSLIHKMRTELLGYKYTDLRFQVVHPDRRVYTHVKSSLATSAFQLS